MICPFCGSNEDRVIDSRAAEGGKVIRRRRQCADCEKRFTTYERVEQTSRIAVVKRDGKRVAFDRDNIARGLDAACGKRPVSEDAKQRLVDEVEEELHREYDREVSSQVIGERVMAKLRDLDEVAYIRFASEYHQFKTVDDIMEELKALTSKPKDVKNQQGLFP
ncbi:MAG: transcriptional repressor NrdR [Phycisphaerales bacterium]|nr:MAG: transcriptional repressor NrdR [Phycisphaerales bacterium]